MKITEKVTNALKRLAKQKGAAYIVLDGEYALYYCPPNWYLKVRLSPSSYGTADINERAARGVIYSVLERRITKE